MMWRMGLIVAMLTSVVGNVACSRDSHEVRARAAEETPSSEARDPMSDAAIDDMIDRSLRKVRTDVTLPGAPAETVAVEADAPAEAPAPTEQERDVREAPIATGADARLFDDAAIASLLARADAGALREAQAALPRLKSGAAQELANQVINESRARDPFVAGGSSGDWSTGGESSTMRQLDSDIQRSVDTITNAGQMNVDRVYLNTVASETDAMVRLIDTELSVSVKDPQVADTLKAKRDAMAARRDQATTALTAQ